MNNCESHFLDNDALTMAHESVAVDIVAVWIRLINVVWPRYREGDAGIIDAGLEDSFSSL